MRLATVVLAAGEGTRLRSRLTKILHPLAGKPIARYVLDTVMSVGAEETIYVVGRDSEQLRQALGMDRIDYVYQEERKGTGHAALQARRVLHDRSDMVLICYGDMPLLRAETLQQLVDNQARGESALTMLTLVHDDSMGFGRVVRGPDGRVLEVVEEKVCTPEQLAIKELNCGVYCFDAAWLWAHIDEIPLNPVKEEYFLTDMVGIAVADGQRVDAISIEDADEVIGINTRAHLAQAEAAIRRRVNARLMASGVTLQDPDATYVEPSVEVGQDTILLANTQLRGATTIGRECTIGPNTLVQDSAIGDRCRVIASVIEGTSVPGDREIGPFAHLRASHRAPEEGGAL
ncbi:MAG: NTP transferase domain-containing protein [Anaerolineae bacterium]|nr:NTP transferase domain-containing protein [Anaerolineae bacterium]